MTFSEHSFCDMNVTVMGLGLLGRGVGDTRFLAEHGANIIVTDLKSYDELIESVVQLKSFPNIRFVLGEHRFEDFRNRNLILKSAGVPIDSPYIAEAKKHHIPVRMSADIFAEIARVPVIGITGTRGKSTVAHLTYAILRAANIPTVLGGNVRGVSTLALLSEITSSYTAVLELDSWQCQGFGEAKISPHIAVITTFFPDHLNYYKGNIDTYLADKANIFINQKSNDTLILGSQAANLIEEQYNMRINAKTIVTDITDLPSEWKVFMPGKHNRYNAALALAASRAIGIKDIVSRNVIEQFVGVPGRLEIIREVNGIKIYNDTTATTPEATLAAISALNNKPRKNIILIMGGADKGLNMSVLISKLIEMKRVILISGTGTQRIISEFSDLPVFNNLSLAVADAFKHAESGDIILFSPAFASFGMFKNEFDRGEQFNKIAKVLP